MTYAWLKVYPEELLGDVKGRQLSDAEKWWLILAWHTARNACVYGELRNEDGAVIDSQAFALIAGIPRAKAKGFLLKLLGLGLAQPAEDGAITFPNLRQAQGDDPTNATRQNRFRNAKRNGQSNARVTGVETPSNAVEVQTQTKEEVPGQSQSSVVDVADLQQIKATDLDDDTRWEIERLLGACNDRDKGTAGRLVALARRGATARHFADARQGITSSKTGGSSSRKACQIVEASLAGVTA